MSAALKLLLLYYAIGLWFYGWVTYSERAEQLKATQFDILLYGKIDTKHSRAEVQEKIVKLYEFWNCMAL